MHIGHEMSGKRLFQLDKVRKDLPKIKWIMWTREERDKYALVPCSFIFDAPLDETKTGSHLRQAILSSAMIPDAFKNRLYRHIVHHHLKEDWLSPHLVDNAVCVDKLNKYVKAVNLGMYKDADEEKKLLHNFCQQCSDSAESKSTVDIRDVTDMFLNVAKSDLPPYFKNKYILFLSTHQLAASNISRGTKNTQLVKNKWCFSSGEDNQILAAMEDYIKSQTFAPVNNLDQECYGLCFILYQEININFAHMQTDINFLLFPILRYLAAGHDEYVIQNEISGFIESMIRNCQFSRNYVIYQHHGGSVLEPIRLKMCLNLICIPSALNGRYARMFISCDTKVKTSLFVSKHQLDTIASALLSGQLLLVYKFLTCHPAIKRFINHNENSKCTPQNLESRLSKFVNNVKETQHESNDEPTVGKSSRWVPYPSPTVNFPTLDMLPFIRKRRLDVPYGITPTLTSWVRVVITTRNDKRVKIIKWNDNKKQRKMEEIKVVPVLNQTQPSQYKRKTKLNDRQILQLLETS